MTLSDEHLIELGRVAEVSSRLEFFLAALIWVLLKVETDIAQIVTAQLSLNARLHLLDSLHRKRLGDPTTDRELKPLLTAVDDAMRDRNTLLHSTWTLSAESDEVSYLQFRARRGTGLRQTIKPQSPSDIRAVVTELHQASAGLSNYLMVLSRRVGAPPTEIGVRPGDRLMTHIGIGLGHIDGSVVEAVDTDTVAKIWAAQDTPGATGIRVSEDHQTIEVITDPPTN